jgi:5-methylcytosine-specific restriction endonuclease McrA
VADRTREEASARIAELQRRRRAEWFRENGPCVGCGSDEDLQVDHRDRAQKVSSNFWTWSAERRAAELAKCQVLCEPCHKEKTRLELSTAEHGTAAMYKRGCSCVACRTYNAGGSPRRAAVRRKEG